MKCACAAVHCKNVCCVLTVWCGHNQGNAIKQDISHMSSTQYYFETMEFPPKYLAFYNFAHVMYSAAHTNSTHVDIETSSLLLVAMDACAVLMHLHGWTDAFNHRMGNYICCLFVYNVEAASEIFANAYTNQFVN